MQFIPSFERKAHQEGLEKGLEKGREEGACQGLLKGIEVGLKLQFGAKGRTMFKPLRKTAYCFCA